MKQIAVKEQLIKRVVKSGNGGAVWVPKKWLGEEVIVVLPDKLQSVKEQVFDVVKPHLDRVVAVFLYGSHARHEAVAGSDIDVFVMVKDVSSVFVVNKSGFDVTVMTIEEFKKAIQRQPVMYYSIVQEAMPIVNAAALDDLRTIPVNKKQLLMYVKETKAHIKSNTELIELDALEGDHLVSSSVAYSLYLRLRGMFIVQHMLSKIPYSGKRFRSWLSPRGIRPQEYLQLYAVYRAVRDSSKAPVLGLSVVEKFLSVLEREVVVTGGLLRGK